MVQRKTLGSGNDDFKAFKTGFPGFTKFDNWDIDGGDKRDSRRQREVTSRFRTV